METQENSWCGGCTKADKNLVQQLHSSLQNEIDGSLKVQLDRSLQLQRDRSLQLQLDRSLQLQQQCSMLRLGQMVQTFSGQQGQLQLLQQQVLALQLQVQNYQKQTNHSAYQTEPQFYLHPQSSCQSPELPPEKEMTSGVRPCLNRCPPGTCPQHLKPDLLPGREQMPQPCVSVSTQSKSGPVPDLVQNVGATSSRPSVQQGVASTFLNCKENAAGEQRISSRDSRGRFPPLPDTGSNGKFVKDNLGRHDISCKASDGLKESEGLLQKDLCSAINHKRIKNRERFYGDNTVGEKRSAGYSAKERAAAVARLDNLYSEAASLIAENERRPWFLLWMFQEMRQIQTDCQWQMLAKLIHNLVVASADAAQSLLVHQKNLTRIQKDGVFYKTTQLQNLLLANRQKYEILREGNIHKRLTKKVKKAKNKTPMRKTHSKTDIDILQSKSAVYIELGKPTVDLEHSQTTMDIEHSQTTMDIGHSKTTLDVAHSQTTVDIGHSQTTIDTGHSQLEQDDENIKSAGFKLDEEEKLDRKWRYNTLARSCVCGGCPLAAGTGVLELDESHWTDGVERQLENNLTNFGTFRDGNKLADEMFSEDIPAYPANARQVQEDDTNVYPPDGNSQDWTDNSAVSVSKQGSPTLEDTVKVPACPQELQPEGESLELEMRCLKEQESLNCLDELLAFLGELGELAGSDVSVMDPSTFSVV